MRPIRISGIGLLGSVPVAFLLLVLGTAVAQTLPTGDGAPKRNLPSESFDLQAAVRCTGERFCSGEQCSEPDSGPTEGGAACRRCREKPNPGTLWATAAEL